MKNKLALALIFSMLMVIPVYANSTGEEKTAYSRAILIQEGEFDIPPIPTAEDYYELINSTSEETVSIASELESQARKPVNTTLEIEDEAFDSLCATIKSAYVDGFDIGTESKVSLEAFKIPFSDDGKSFLREVVSYVINDSPELFYAGTTYGYSYDYSQGIITEFIPGYIEQYTHEDVVKFEEAATKAIEKIKEDCDYANGGNNPEAIAIATHDYLINNNVYDTIVATSGASEDARVHHAYSALVDGVTVCQGYSLAYMYLCRRMGVECYYVSSREMKHGWNAVKIGDYLYHVDLTNDDPLFDLVGIVGHNNMFASDTAMKAERADSGFVHRNWEILAETKVANAEDYDNAFWYSEGINSPLIRKDGYYYYLKYDDNNDKTFLIKRNNSDGLETIISSGGFRWYSNVEKTNLWAASFSGLFQYGGRLYYNTSDEIRSIKFDGTDEKIEFTPELAEDEDIYGISIEGNTLHYAVRKLKSSYPNSFAESTPRIAPLSVLSSVGSDPSVCQSHNIEGSTEIILLNPTCMMEGKKGYLCNTCGMIVELEDIEKTSHASSGVFKTYSEATCMADKKQSSKCRYGCGTTLIKTIENSKLAHAWDDGVVTKKPTRVEEGELTCTCTMGCGSTMTKPIEPLSYDKVLEKKSDNEYIITLPKGGKTAAIEEFASKKGANWKVSYSPSGYALISKKGVISGTKEGNTVITLNNGEAVYTINVHISLPKYEQKTLFLNVGEGSKNIGLYNTNLEPVFGSSNTSVATVDMLGNVTGLKPGKAKISAVICGKKYITNVKVCNPVISGKSKLRIGKKQNLKIINGLKNTEWSSLDTSVITVDSKGVARAVGYGKTVITAKNNGKMVTLNIEVPMFKISGKDYVAIGQTLSLMIKNGYGKTQWRVENITGQAEVRDPAKGIISAISPGIVRVIAQNSGSTVYKEITVK